MVIEVALGGGRRACFRRRQTEKERSVTVINVLAETETVHSQGPVVTSPRRGTPGPTANAASRSRGGTGGGLIIITWIIYYTKIYYFFFSSWWTKAGVNWNVGLSRDGNEIHLCVHKKKNQSSPSGWLMEKHLSRRPRLPLASRSETSNGLRWPFPGGVGRVVWRCGYRAAC